MVRWVVFDIGHVVINITPERTVAKLAELGGLSEKQIREHLNPPREVGDTTPPFAELFGIGRISKEEYIRSLTWPFLRKVHEREIVDAEHLTLDTDKAETLALIEEIKSRVGLACFSNTQEIHWDRLKETRDWFELFEHQFASHLIGASKPDPKGFKIVQNALNASPEECVLIDDVEFNVRAATKAGWHGIQFNDFAQVRRELLEILG